MKKTAYSLITALLAVLSFTSCNGWLEATSSTQFQADQIFESRDGYLDALTGVYLTMGNSSVYGSDMTWKYMDLISYTYNTFTGSKMAKWQSHEYSNVDVRADIAAIWQGAYNIIANANMLLDRLEEGRSLFSSELEFNLIKGELLAIRAYVHFDLMRMFGTTGFLGENASKLTVPYVTSYGMTATGQLTNEETLGLLLADVEEALELLADDPVTGVKPDGFDQGPNADGYWDKRQRHLNLYAVEALAARIHHWNFNLDKAAEYAAEALEGAQASGLAHWLDVDGFLITYKDEEKDWTFSTEHIFGLEITGLSNMTMGTLIPGNSSSDVFHLSKDAMDFAYNTLVFIDLENDDYSVYQFDGLQEALEDIRGTAALFKYNQSAYDCYKFYGTSSSSAKYRNIMPMLKMSEMCYILSEKYFVDGDNAKALEMLDQVRLHRGVQEPLGSDRYSFIEIEREAAKEFLNEGQGVFWRRHWNNIIDGGPFTLFRRGIYNYTGIKNETLDNQLIFPYPDAETDYGRKQEL